MDPVNKRYFERRNIRIPVMCWEFDGDKPTGRGIEIINRDLSESGLAFESKSIYSIEKILLAEIHLPGQKKPLVTKLKIVRIEAMADKEAYLIGTTFLDMKLEDKYLIALCLDQLNLYKLLEAVIKAGASDLHLIVGRSPILRIHGRIQTLKIEPILEGQIKAMVYPLLNSQQIENFESKKELDFAFSPNILSRYRVNLHFQRGFLEATLRNVPTTIRSFEELGLPAPMMEQLCKKKSGLILISGTTGAGKTTTVASMVDYINKTQERVIITMEDPIEYTHVSRRGVIKQRELGSDTLSYAEALTRALRQDPDVIVVGELLNRESVLAAIRAAEAGHLIISTIHAPDTTQTIERIVTLFPPEHASSVCQQLASCLLGIIFQQLIPNKQGSLALATELLMINTAAANLIRESKFFQIPTIIQTGRELGMYTLESKLKELYEKAVIEYNVLQEYLKRK